jgi:hypothetical protein
MRRVAFLGLVVCLLGPGCNDSKHPLSDPRTAKPDNRLIGIWRERGGGVEMTDYYVGHAGKNFPDSVMRIVLVTHGQGKVEPPEEYLAFSTLLGGKTYLNMVLDGDKRLVKLLDDKGWKAEVVDCYTLMKYQLDGDKLVLWMLDEDAKERAIKSGKVKGVVQRSIGTFTDTTENVARFVAEAGDSLLNTKEPGRFERIADRRRSSGLLFPEQVERAMMHGDPPKALDNIPPVPLNRLPAP